MAIRQNIIQVPPVVGPTLALGCGEAFRAATKRAYDAYNDAERAASKARTIRDKEFFDRQYIKDLACLAIESEDPPPCIDRYLNRIRCNSGGSEYATPADLKAMKDICQAAIVKENEEYNIRSAEIYDTTMNTAGDVMIAANAAAGKAVDVCCKATPKSEGCNSNGYGNIPARSV